MDTSETYVKMCEKAEKIQESWEPKHGDFIQERFCYKDGKIYSHLDPLLVIEDRNKNAVIVYYPESVYEKTSLKMTCWRVTNKWYNDSTEAYWWSVWLPRQDQLQEMIGPNWGRKIISRFNSFCHPLNILMEIHYSHEEEEAKHGELYISQFGSMEQLWLAFVMKEKYGKVWNGEDWVAEKEEK